MSSAGSSTEMPRLGPQQKKMTQEARVVTMVTGSAVVMAAMSFLLAATLMQRFRVGECSCSTVTETQITCETWRFMVKETHKSERGNVVS
jgi:hypothetical protein